jgi:hypothetical protein
MLGTCRRFARAEDPITPSLSSARRRVVELKLLTACPFQRIPAAGPSLFGLAERPRDEQEVAGAPLDGAHPREQRVGERVPDRAEPELVARLGPPEQLDDL